MNDIVLCQQYDSRITRLILNRPSKRNALTIELMESLCGQMRQLEMDPDCRVLILQGAGPVFCAGLDLAEAAQLDVAKRSAQWVATLFRSICTSPLVTIAAAHGAAMAGGAGLMAACDLAVASDDLKIGFPEVRRGLVPALVSKVLADRLRDSEMRELFLLAEPIDAKRAMQLGLVTRLVDESDVLAEAVIMAKTICKGGPQAVRQTKRFIRQLSASKRSDDRGRSVETHTRARSSDEAREGLAAFLEHRDPRW